MSRLDAPCAPPLVDGRFGAATRPRVAVLILNWCNEIDTIRCLDSVRASDYPNALPLLIDNGSPDGSGARLAERYPDVAFIQTGANCGYAGGNNYGFDWARARNVAYVLVLNNDAELAPDCITRLVALAEGDPTIGVVTPKILDRDDRARIWYAGGSLSVLRASGTHWREGARDSAADDPAAGTRITFATGCCFLITRRALEVVRGFEPSYFAYNEDVDLSYRLVDAGLDLALEPAARVYHRWSAGPPTPFQIRQRDRNRRRFAKLRLAPPQRLGFAVWFYTTRVARCIQYAALRDRARAVAIARAAVGALDDAAI